MKTSMLKKTDCLFTFLLAGVIMTTACFFAGILPGGAYRAVNTDTMDQMAAMSALLARKIFGGGELFYSMETSLGQNTSLLFAFCAYSPFTILYVLIPDVYLATMIGLILKIALSAMCFHLFLQYGLHYKSRGVIFFALCYGLCGFQYEYMLSSNLMDALYLLPLVMLCLLRAVEKERFCLLCISYTAAFCVQFYCGFLIGLFSFVSMLVLLIYKDGRFFLKNRRRFLMWYGISVLTAVLMSMLLLFPAISFFADSVGFNSLIFREIPGLTDILYSLYFGRPTSLRTHIPFLYCGLPVLLLLPVYFAEKSISRKEKIYAGVALGSALLTIWVEPVYLFLHAFNRPDGFTVRYAFLYVFLMVTIVARLVLGRDHKEFAFGETKKYVLYMILQIALAVGIIMVHDKFGEAADRKGVVFGLYGTVIFLTLWGIYGWYWIKGKKEQWKFPLALVLLTLELGVQAWFNACEQGRTAAENYQSWDAQMQYFEARWQQDGGKEDFRRAHLGNAPFLNQSAMYGYPGAAQFASSNYSALYKLMVRMGDAVTAVQYKQTGATDLTDMLLGIRYRGRLTKADVTPNGQEGPGYEIYTRALPIGYMAAPGILQPLVFDGNVFNNQNRLLSSLCGEEMVVYRPSEIFDEYCNNAEHIRTDSGYAIRSLTEDTYGEVMIGIPKGEYEHAYAYFQLLPFSEEVKEAFLPENMAGNIIQYSNNDRKDSGARTESVYENAIIEMTKDENAFVLLIADFDRPDKLYSYTEHYFYYQDESVLDEAYERLASGGWVINAWQDGYVDAQVTATEEMPVLFMTIPYDKGWEALVDGVPTRIEPVASDAFMAIPLQPGAHRVVLEYHAPGAAEGKMLFGIGAILFLLLLWKEYKGEKGNDGREE